MTESFVSVVNGYDLSIDESDVVLVMKCKDAYGARLLFEDIFERMTSPTGVDMHLRGSVTSSRPIGEASR